MIIPRHLIRVLTQLLGEHRPVVQVIDTIASVHDRLPAALQAQAHWPERLQQCITNEGNIWIKLVRSWEAAVDFLVEIWRWQLERHALLCVPTFREVEGHAIVGRIHEASVRSV